MKTRPDIDIACLSDIGRRREQNEDYFCVVEPQDEGELDRRGRLIAIADGMGGYEGGQIASRLALDTLENYFSNSATPEDADLLADAFARCQQAILDYAATHRNFSEMGTTCTAVILQNGLLRYGHVGDSRLYLLSQQNGERKLRQITEDHSLVQQLVKAGALTPSQAEHHQNRNVLTAAMGLQGRELTADFSPRQIAVFPGDVLLLSTDGLHTMMTSDEIEKRIDSLPAAAICEELVRLANERGGPDNITVLVTRILGPSY